jgi:two-component system sensor histidine kinase EvgS
VAECEQIVHVEECKDLKYNILVVDDHLVSCVLISQRLQFLGHEVDTALSGREALSKLDKKNFHIIITDFNMPEMDGLEFTKTYREQEKNKKNNRTIIIGLTADARQIQIENAIQAGMDDCLFKPISIDQLEMCISTHSIMIDDISPAEMASMIQHVLEGVTSGDVDLMRRLLAAFIQASNDDIKNLELACSKGDCQFFLMCLNRLEDASKIIGAEILARCCSEWKNSPRLTWCMLSALRQIQEGYQRVQSGIYFLLNLNVEEKYE